MTLLVLILSVVLAVAAHEAGHYIAARRYGIRIVEVVLGSGPTVATWTRGATTWRLRPLPVSGSVRLAGMTIEAVEDGGEDGTFIAARPRHRFTVSIAGVMVNAALAWIAMVVAITAGTGRHNLEALLAAPFIAIGLLARLIAAVMAAIGQVTIGAFTGEGLDAVLDKTTLDAGGALVGEPTRLFVYAMVFALVNTLLAVVNALPIYPMDGFNAALALIDTQRYHYLLGRYGRRGTPVRPLSAAQLKWVTIPMFALLTCVTVLLAVNTFR